MFDYYRSYCTIPYYLTQRTFANKLRDQVDLRIGIVLGIGFWNSRSSIQGMSSKSELLTYAEYVSALCTHRPSLLPNYCAREVNRAGVQRIDLF